MKIKGYWLLMIIGMFIVQPSVIKAQKSKADQYPTVAKDAAWCWFSDPRAIYHNGKKEAIYFGYINMKGDVMVRSLNMRTNKMDEYNLHPKLQADDHAVPSFLFLPDGKILAFYSHHNGDVFLRKSKNSEDITQWENERVLVKQTKTDRFCYTNPFMLSDENNRIYMFGRIITRQGSAKVYTQTDTYFIYSDDYGETWSDRVLLLDNSGRDNPPYVKYTSDNKSRIDFLFTNGHPKLGYDISIHHMYFKNGTFYQTNGQKIGDIKDLPIKIKDVNTVYKPGASKIRSWIWDIALDRKGNPVVTYARYPSELDHQYYYAKWDGNKWLDQKVTDAGPYITIIKPGKKLMEAHYSGGIVLDHNDPDNIYLSRKINDHFEIEHRNMKKGMKITALTHHSKADNIRPYIVDRNTTGKPILMWMYGYYYHFTDFDTELKILINK